MGEHISLIAPLNTCTPPKNVFDVKLRVAVCSSNMAPIGAKLCQNVFQTIPVKSIFARIFFFSTKNFRVGQHFLPFEANFGGRTWKWTSKSNSLHFFALDAPIMRSVRPKIDEIVSVSAAKAMAWVQVLKGTGTWKRDYVSCLCKTVSTWKVVLE